MIHTGTIMDIEGARTTVFTKTCDMVSIKTQDDFILGQQVTFSNRDMFSLNNLLHLGSVPRLAAAAVLLLIIVSAVLFTALRPAGTPAFDTVCAAVVSVDINPSLEISVNKDNKIIDVLYANSAGKELSDELDLRNKTVEEGIARIIALAKQKGYLEENSLVLVAAALSPSEEASGEYEQQLRQILTSMGDNSGDADIVPVFIEDSGIIGKAEESGLSIGKQLLYQSAVELGMPISMQQIKDLSITDILDSLKLIGKDGSLVPETDAEDAFIPPADFSAGVRVASEENGLMVQWTKAPQAAGFLCYKIVASVSNSSPAFPGDGYALEIKPFDTTSAFLETGCPYQNGDTGGTLAGGQYYYISVTYVYEHGSIKGNAVKIMMPAGTGQASPSPSETPEESASPAGFDPKLTVKVSGGRLKFAWTPLKDTSVTHNGTTYKGFKFYKVVASLTDPTPVYPDNGYLHVASDLGTSSWTVDPSSDDYNQQPKLEPGKKYYFSVTYVFDNGKFSAGTVSTKIPDYDEEPKETGSDFDSPQLSVSVDCDKVYFNWTALPADTVTYGGELYSGFKYYKVVASETDSTPIYPDNGYLYVASDICTSYWSVNPERGNYNKSPVLEPGKTYYFSVTYVFDNGKFVTNTATAAMPEYCDNIPDFGTPALSVSADDNAVYFSWTELPGDSVKYNGTAYTGFRYYKVVASETDSTPSYPENGYLYAAGCGTTCWSVNPAKDNYNESPVLEPGKTYYFSITYVFSNGSFVTPSVTAAIPLFPSEDEPSAPVMTAPALFVSSDGSALNFSWTALPDSTVSYNGTVYSDFSYYKVVASATNPNPVYPDDGYIYFTSDLGSSGWSASADSAGLVSGQTYYFSITYVFGSGKFVSNTVQYTVP